MAKKKNDSNAKEISKESGYYARHLRENKSDKKLVAKELINRGLISDNDSILLDAGTSATAVAEEIFSSDLENLSILTHNMDIFLENYQKPTGKSGHQLLLTGGCFDSKYNALYGFLTERAYEKFHPNIVILAISGLTASTSPHFRSGVYCHAVVETRIKEILFSLPTERKIIIADHTKIGKVDSHMFGDLSKIISHVESPGKIYILTTMPPGESNAENNKDPKENGAKKKLKLYEDTISTLKRWQNIDVIEVNRGITDLTT